LTEPASASAGADFFVLSWSNSFDVDSAEAIRNGLPYRSSVISHKGCRSRPDPLQLATFRVIRPYGHDANIISEGAEIILAGAAMIVAGAEMIFSPLKFGHT
jgi:hypothetical protein